MSNLMAASPDFGDKVWPASSAFADHEKRGPCSVAIEQIENSQRVLFIGSIIDRQPHGAAIRRERREYAEQALGGGRKNPVKDEWIRSDEKHGARGSMPGKPQR